MNRFTCFLSAVLLGSFVVTGFSLSHGGAARDAAPDARAEVVAYDVDPAHTNVAFKVRHLGISNVTGHFRTFDAKIEVAPEDLSTLSVTADIDVASIDTGIERRDDHLRSADFFEAETYPRITFASKEVRNIEGNEFEIVGDLTIKDVTKEIVLEGELLGTAVMRGTPRIAFEAEGEIDRHEFGLTWNNLTEAGGVVVGPTVTIELDVEAMQAQPAEE